MNSFRFQFLIIFGCFLGFNTSLYCDLAELNQNIKDLQIKLKDLDTLLSNFLPIIPPPPPPPIPTTTPTPLTPPKPKYLPILNQNELQKLSKEEKNKSDQLILNAMREVSHYEFIDYNEALRFLNNKFNALRSNKDFKLRHELAQFVSDLDNDTFTLKKSLGTDEKQFFKDLQERFGKGNDPIKMMKDVLTKTVFDEALFDDEIDLALQIIIISIAASQRSPITINLLKKSDKYKSDKLFADQLKDFQAKIENKETEGFIFLIIELNKLRINIAFYKYTAMLKDLKKAEKGQLKEPILNFLRYLPGEQIITLKALLKNYVFEKEIIDTIFETNPMKRALSEQFAKVTKKEKAKPDIKDYLTTALQKFEGIAGLEKIIETLIKDYNQDLNYLLIELKKPLPDSAIIVTKLQEILQKPLTKGQIERIQNQINQDIENKKIIDAIANVKRAVNPWSKLSSNLKKEFPEPRSQRIETIIKQMDTNFFVTPRDIWLLFGRSLNIALAKQNYYVDRFIKTFSSLGILFLIFQHFMNELNRNANFDASIEMLFNSIQIVNNPEVKKDIIGADKAIEMWLKKGDTTIAMNASLAPVIVDRDLEGKSLGKGFYSDQIKLMVFKDELKSLIDKLKELMTKKDDSTINEFIMSLDKLTKKPKDITKSEYYVDKPKFEKFKNNLKTILEKSIGSSK